MINTKTYQSTEVDTPTSSLLKPMPLWQSILLTMAPAMLLYCFYYFMMPGLMETFGYPFLVVYLIGRPQFRERNVLFVVLLAIWVVLFIAGITFAAKKFDRYLLPAFVSLDVIAALGCTVWILRGSDVTDLPRRTFGWAGVVIVIVAAVVGFLNVKASAEHLQTNRDPGVYVTTGRWLATEGSLVVDGVVGVERRDHRSRHLAETCHVDPLTPPSAHLRTRKLHADYQRWWWPPPGCGAPT